MEVEGEISENKISCKDAVIRVHRNFTDRTGDLVICGTNADVVEPIISVDNEIKITFLTSPEKVNGLGGFNFSWTEIRIVKRKCLWMKLSRHMFCIIDKASLR